jgi:hypothetical protein
VIPAQIRACSTQDADSPAIRRVADHLNCNTVVAPI